MTAAPIREALARLGIRHLLLGLPDRCFPSDPDEDTGAGSPRTRAGERLLAMVARCGFTGIQLGPQGETSPMDASPYTGTLFARGRLGLAVARLTGEEWEGLLDADAVSRLVRGRPAGPPDRVAYAYAHGAHRDALALACDAFTARRARGELAGMAARLDAFVAAHDHWLLRDGLYEALQAAHGGRHWSEWPTERDLWHEVAGAAARREALRRAFARRLARHAFAQFVLHAEHAAFRASAAAAGLSVWADLQTGVSEREAWGWPDIFLDGYALGAPPSRTNPEGQAWGYPVLDPAQADAVDRFVAARARKTFAEYDGVRVDHPQGLVCPWVYRPDAAAGVAAVRRGARLRDAPDLPDHPRLAPLAIARRDQLTTDPHTPRWADDWVVALDDAQVERYAALFARLVEAARDAGRGIDAVACEVLSTCPYPLRRVLERYGVGRFRVTQKAKLHDPSSVYRTENAAADDWLMVGTHDTAPIWLVAEGWRRDGTAAQHAAYLAWRLEPDAARRDAFAAALLASPNALVQAQLADLFASRARNVLVFFADAFGLRALYNRPGVISPDNWVLRLPADHAARLASRLREDAALNVPAALATALRARGVGDAALLAALDAEAAAWRAGGSPASAA